MLFNTHINFARFFVGLTLVLLENFYGKQTEKVKKYKCQDKNVLPFFGSEISILAKYR